MNTNRMIRTGMAAAAVMLLLAGCATQEAAVTQADIDALRAEIAQIRVDSGASSDSAAKSAASAELAAAKAEEAADKADRIFMQSMRK